LDGVELLLPPVGDAGSAAPPAGTTPPASRGEAVARAGGVRLRDGLRAVLESETGLQRITPTREQLAAAVDALPLGADPGKR
jgi:hypothetical protein